jgi:DNA repair exonuclease SbcCD ATPase subunit
MITEIIKKLKSNTDELYKAILEDIEDVKKANHESLVSRNELKIELMDTLTKNKEELNAELANAYEKGEDISIYKDAIDELELDLRKLYETNGKLASIVLPVKEMYKDIIEEITQKNGGRLIEITA